jgi:hypothetical protein
MTPRGGSCGRQETRTLDPQNCVATFGRCNVKKNSNFKNKTFIINSFEHLMVGRRQTPHCLKLFLKEGPLIAPSPAALRNIATGDYKKVKFTLEQAAKVE